MCFVKRDLLICVGKGNCVARPFPFLCSSSTENLTAAIRCPDYDKRQGSEIGEYQLIRSPLILVNSGGLKERSDSVIVPRLVVPDHRV